MEQEFMEIRVKGKNTLVPCRRIDDEVVIVSGRWIRIARVHDEEWKEGERVKDPESFVARLKEQGFPADIFTFLQMPPAKTPKFHYHCDWDNFATIEVSSFDNWWRKLPQESRKNTRRAAKRGVTVRLAELDDHLVRGIADIYNETPVRQGKRFPHYGKDFDTVKKEISTLTEQSEFLGAYFGNELIGFIKLVYMGDRASILHIVSKNAHYDKRPTNALIAKAVERCSQKSVTHLLYGRYTYGRKTNSSLMELKRRNAFEEMRVPRYYLPLTFKGRIVVRLRLYRGLLGLLPSGVVNTLVNMRARLLTRSQDKANSASLATIVEQDRKPECQKNSLAEK